MQFKFRKMGMIASLLFVVVITAAYAKIEPAKAYCEHARYTYDAINNMCVFDNANSCNADAFLKETCGIRFRREIPCRKINQEVYPEFEKCCEGEPVFQKKSDGPAVCLIPKDYTGIYIGSVFAIILLLAAIIGFIVIKRKRGLNQPGKKKRNKKEA